MGRKTTRRGRGAGVRRRRAMLKLYPLQPHARLSCCRNPRHDSLSRTGCRPSPMPGRRPQMHWTCCRLRQTPTPGCFHSHCLHRTQDSQTRDSQTHDTSDSCCEVLVPVRAPAGLEPRKYRLQYGLHGVSHGRHKKKSRVRRRWLPQSNGCENNVATQFCSAFRPTCG